MPIPRMFLAALCLAGGSLLVSGCTQFPELDALPPDQTAEAPRLVPIEDIRAAVGAPRSSAGTADALAARAQRLKNRAALMQGPILDPATRARLAAAIAAGQA